MVMTFVLMPIRVGLKDYVNNISEIISELSSLKEVENYENELNTLMSDFDVSNSLVSHYIEERKEALAEKQDNEEKYSGSSFAFSAQMSDEQIKSLFSGLKKIK